MADTISLFERAALVKVGLLVPTWLPFIFHWITGTVPPCCMRDEKVTEDPLQEGLVDEEMEICGVSIGFMVTSIGSLIAIWVFKQVAFTITSTVIWLLPVRLEVVKRGLFVPDIVPFTFH